MLYSPLDARESRSEIGAGTNSGKHRASPLKLRLGWAGLGFRSDHGLTGMYGPPRCRKRKWKRQNRLRKCIRPLLEHKPPGLDGMRCALVLFSNAALEGFSV